MKSLSLFLLMHLFLSTYAFAQSVVIPYYTGFDSEEEREGWKQYRNGVLINQSWEYHNNGYTAPSSLFHNYNMWGSSNDTIIDWFVSPPLNFSSAGAITFKVKFGGFDIPLNDNFQVFFGIGNQDPTIGNFVSVANLSNIQPLQQWIDTGANAPFINDSVYIAFRYKNIGTRRVSYSIDNIIINYDTYLSKEELNINETTLKISPNPVSDKAKIVLENCEFGEEVTLTIFDLYGKKVKEWFAKSQEDLIISRDGLSSGVYILDVKKGIKSIGFSKLVIQ